MKIELDTDKKTIIVLEEIKLEVLFDKCKEMGIRDYTLIPIMLESMPNNHSLT